MTVEKLGFLTLSPAPDEDIIEGVVDVVLDDNQELFIPVSVHPDSPGLLHLAAEVMLSAELVQVSVVTHVDHRSVVTVCHKESPQSKSSLSHVPPHLYPSLIHSLPSRGFISEHNGMKLLTSEGKSLFIIVFVDLLILKSIELLQVLRDTEMLPEVNTMFQFVENCFTCHQKLHCRPKKIKLSFYSALKALKNDEILP